MRTLLDLRHYRALDVAPRAADAALVLPREGDVGGLAAVVLSGKAG